MALYNVDCYYDDLQRFMQTVRERKFMNFKCEELYSLFPTADGIVNYIETYVASGTHWRKLKIGE